MDYGAPRLVDEIDRAKVPHGSVALWWLGQASFVIKGPAATVYVDPYLAQSDRRLTAPAFAPSAATNADVVLLTHDHGDHVDPETLPGIAGAAPRATFVAPRPIVARVRNLVGEGRVIAAVADEPLHVHGVEVLPVPAKHEEFDETPDGYPYLGYSLRVGSVTLHHTGDTIPYEGQAERLKAHGVHVALVPINGRDYYRTRAGIIGNMDYREAAELVAQIGSAVAIPIHYGMFRENTAPPGHFVSYMHEFHPEQSIHVMGRYSRFVYAPG